jgi:hypothetical protein
MIEEEGGALRAKSGEIVYATQSKLLVSTF